MFLQPRGRAKHAAPRWDTYETPKAHVLGIARTLTSATRLRDVMRLLRPQDGIEVSYTVNPGSVFGAGLEEYLRGLGVTVLSWREARRRRFDLMVACAVHRSMYRRGTPLVVLPHGAGYNRLVTESTGDAVTPAGLSRRELMRWGRVLPACIGVSHEEQIARLGVSCPEAVPRAQVVGDLCFDRIRDSLSQRDLYRQRLGVTGRRRLVVVNSTWSEHSLLGRHPDLPHRLVASLPADEFAVALVLHPNVWARHSEHGVMERLARAVDAGLLVIPPQEGWRAAIVAADRIVGDHGSTTFYGAALHRVTQLAATGLDELDPASPTAAFARGAHRLDPHGKLLEQLLDASGTHSPENTGEGEGTGTADDTAENAENAGNAEDVFRRQLGARGAGAEITRDILYSYLRHRDIPPPDFPLRPDPVPPPAPVKQSAATTYDVTGSVADDGAVELRRWPVVEGHHEQGRGFYAVADHETDPRWPQYAEVVARTAYEPELPPGEWASGRFRAGSNLNVAVAALGSHSCLVVLRDGRRFEARTAPAWGDYDAPLDPLVLGAAVQVLTAYGRFPGEGTRRAVVRTGTRDLRVRFVPADAADAADGAETEGPADHL